VDQPSAPTSSTSTPVQAATSAQIASTSTPSTSQAVQPASTAAKPVVAVATPAPSSTVSAPAVISTPVDKVPSAAAAPSTTLAPVQTLSSKPAPQWEQHKPGPNDEMVTPADQLTPKPVWYKKDGIADIERTMLPEWFDSSASHRTPVSYLQAREKILAISYTIANRNVTNAMIRRSIVGDVGSLQRLRSFLVNWGIINEDAINDSAPTPAVLREKYKDSRKFDDAQLRDELVDAVVQQSKRRKVDQSESTFIPIDWEHIALHVGHGATSEECERTFLSMPLTDTSAMSTERSITPDGSHDAQKVAAAVADGPSEQSKEIIRQEVIRDLIEKTDPDVIRKVTEAAMQATDSNLKQAQSVALLGLVASRAVEEARTQENALASVLSQLVNQRMEKLENRMVMMDDIEGILEAEKLALELERRDLYTARCRHWFGGA
jgi:SWI/SNF related-matrix-associated actin-dependent regulator of chromatin subfamily C